MQIIKFFGECGTLDKNEITGFAIHMHGKKKVFT